MTKLSYQEINKLVNRTKATFYLSGLPSKDCENTGKQVFNDYRTLPNEDGVVIEKHYEKLEFTRDFDKRPLTLTFVLLMFAYYMATFYIFVQMCDDITNTEPQTWVLFSAFLLIPAILVYPYTRKKVFLYQVLGYRVDALSDVISGIYFVLQILLVTILATGINMYLAYYKGYDLAVSLIACMMMFVLISGYAVLILTRIFKPGRTFIKFNHHHKFFKAKNKIDETIEITGDIDVIASDDVEVRENTKDLAEITILMDQIINEEVERAKYEVDHDEIEEDDTVTLDPSQMVSLKELETGEKFEEHESIIEENVTPFERIFNNVVVSEVDAILEEITGEIMGNNEITIDLDEIATIDELEHNVVEIAGVIDNADVVVDVAPEINNIVEVEEDLIEEIEPENNVEVELEQHLEEEIEIIDNDDIIIDVAPAIEDIVELEEDVLEEIDDASLEKNELDEMIIEEEEIIENKF